MPAATPGIHHVTAIGSDPGGNLAFYTGTLGLRLVKRSVNQDDVSVYHLFYGDRRGSPGTSMTFFPYEDARPGRVGTGQASSVAFVVPESSVDYWVERLDGEEVDADDPVERFGDTVVPFRDPDGVPLELVGRADAPAGDPPDGPVPGEHAIRGFFGVTLSLVSADPTAALLETMGYREVGTGRDRRRFEATGGRGEADPDGESGGDESGSADDAADSVGSGELDDADDPTESGGRLGAVVDLVEDPQAPAGRPGAGTVHHVAFRTTADDQPAWRDVLREQGLRPTDVIDRKWFRSVYVRERGGVLFEFATEEPGYTVDEDLDELGERLVLPEWLEDRRGEIEAGLPELSPERGAR